jgi:hypothetical protein
MATLQGHFTVSLPHQAHSSLPNSWRLFLHRQWRVASASERPPFPLSQEEGTSPTINIQQQEDEHHFRLWPPSCNRALIVLCEPDWDQHRPNPQNFFKKVAFLNRKRALQPCKNITRGWVVMGIGKNVLHRLASGSPWDTNPPKKPEAFLGVVVHPTSGTVVC